MFDVPVATVRRAPVEPRLIACLAAVYLIWGSTYLAMRFVVAELPPLLTASLRFGSAGLVLLVIAKRRGSPWPRLADWLRVLPIGTLMFCVGNGFVAISQRSVSSGGAAVVCATMPLWVGVLGVFTGQRPTRREWLSLAVGFAGIMILMGGPSLQGEPLHLVLIVLAPVGWALASLLVRRLPGPVGKDAFLLPAMEMLTGGAMLAIVGGLRGEHLAHDVTATAWLALGYLWLFGSLIAFTAFTWLLRNTRAAIATSYAYVNPGVAVVLGTLLSGEPLGATTLIANALIVAAVWLVLRPGPRPVAVATPTVGDAV